MVLVLLRVQKKRMRIKPSPVPIGHWGREGETEDGPRLLQDCPNTAQDRSKTDPRQLKTVPNPFKLLQHVNNIDFYDTLHIQWFGLNSLLSAL